MNRPTGPIATAIIGTGINVCDIDRSIGFYHEVLGLIQTQRWEFPGVTEVVLHIPDQPATAGLVLAHGLRDDLSSDVSSFGRLIFGVDNADAVCDRARRHGGEVEREPTDGPGEGIRIGIVKDPDGVRLELVERPDGR